MKKFVDMANQYDSKLGQSPVLQKDFTVVARGTQFHGGTLVSEGDIRLDGEFQGVVKTKTKLVIGDASVVKADVCCNEIDVYGSCECKEVVARLVILRQNSKFNGSIAAVELLIERGAVFNGCSRILSEEEYNKQIGTTEPLLDAELTQQND